MFRFSHCAALAAITVLGASAAADTVDLTFTGHTGLNTISLNGGTAFNGNHAAGHLSHSIDSGPRTGQSFNTFCIELAEFANGGSSTYEIVDLADAPRSNTPDDQSDNYGQTKADGVVGVISKAIDLGWIDINLQATPGSLNAENNADRMSAIQAAIWAVLFDSTATSGDADVASALMALNDQSLNTSTFDLMQGRLRAVVADGEQDQLIVVPLPPAALAGLGMLGLCAGVRAARRR